MKQLYREEDIKHEVGAFWVLDVGSRGYQVYETGATHSTKVASIGLGNGLGLERAIKEAERRHAANGQPEATCRGMRVTRHAHQLCALEGV